MGMGSEGSGVWGIHHEGLRPEAAPDELVEAVRRRDWLPHPHQALPLGKVQGMDLHVAITGRTVDSVQALIAPKQGITIKGYAGSHMKRKRQALKQDLCMFVTEYVNSCMAHSQLTVELSRYNSEIHRDDPPGGRMPGRSWRLWILRRCQ